MQSKRRLGRFTQCIVILQSWKPRAVHIKYEFMDRIAVLLCGGHLGGADASAPPFPFILHTLHAPPVPFRVRLLTSNRSVMRSTTTTMTPKKIFLTPFKLKMASNGSMVTLRPQKSSHVGWFSWSAERLRVAVD